MNPPTIIFEDHEFLVIDKPAGWITNSAGTTTTQPVVQNWIADNFKFSINNFQFRNGIVHRLDKETSGILLIAKTKEAFENLQSQFKERLVKKTYIALCHGAIDPPSGEINAQVGRLPWRRDRFGVLVGGREAITRYRTITNHQSPASPAGRPITKELFSLLELAPKTGRTHQIRIHLKHIDHPIVADSFYAGRKRSKKDREWCPRMFLHASEIIFSHPKTGKTIGFKSEIPIDLKQAVVDKLQKVS